MNIDEETPIILSKTRPGGNAYLDELFEDRKPSDTLGVINNSSLTKQLYHTLLWHISYNNDYNFY